MSRLALDLSPTPSQSLHAIIKLRFSVEDTMNRRQFFMNRRQFFVPTTAGALASAYGTPLIDLAPVTSALAQGGREPLGGQPPPGSTPSVKDFDYQIKYQ